MNSAKVILKKGEDKRIRRGHLWVFSNEIQCVDDHISDGDIVKVYSSGNLFLGYGFYNRKSLISVRLFHRSFNGDFSVYSKEMISQARSRRLQIYPARNSYRLIFSESDFMPGLITDKYNDTYVIQVYSAGMERYLKSVTECLISHGAKNIFSINDSYFRKLEGLPDEDYVYTGEKDTEVINDGYVKYIIDFKNAQKTGFYFDQTENREFIHRFVKGKTVLDGFCNTGGFGLHALFAGASQVTFVDSSLSALESLKENLKLNGFRNSFDIIKTDMFDYLEECVRSGRKFDVIMLDPPSFAKNKKSVKPALKGYEKLAKLALRCINNGGFFVYSSCSQHIDRTDFLNSVNSAAYKTSVNLQLIKLAGASADHPVLPAMPETDYLKFAVFCLV
ncbi:MAG: class I SAM-dependent rRNA methyltransferase [Ignavibacteria bacterium]|nr:class I SAM-dependent rRNA methyltransferase [Ignavibacteria bacterium]